MITLSRSQLASELKGYQRRIQLGDNLPSLSAFAKIAGVHRDTIYALIAGERISERSQYAISRALKEVMESKCNQPSRLLSIDLGRDGPRLKFGFANKNILSWR